MSSEVPTHGRIGRTVIEQIKQELAKLQEDMLFTEKAHFAAAASSRAQHLILGISATLASGASAGTIIANVSATLSGVLALVGTLAAALLTFLKPEQVAQQHLAAARDLGELRVVARQIMNVDITDEVPNDTLELRNRITEVATQKAAVDRGAPSLSERSFQRARAKIRQGHFDHG
jgi:hypothetical protein